MRLKSPVSHRRAIMRLPDEKWVVLDKLHSSGKHIYRLHWLLMDVPFDWDEKRGLLALQTAAGPFSVQVGASVEGGQSSLVRAESSSCRGWHSPYYNSREPALSLALSLESDACYFWSVFGPGEDISMESIRSYTVNDSIVDFFQLHGK